MRIYLPTSKSKTGVRILLPAVVMGLKQINYGIDLAAGW